MWDNVSTLKAAQYHLMDPFFIGKQKSQNLSWLETNSPKGKYLSIFLLVLQEFCRQEEWINVDITCISLYSQHNFISLWRLRSTSLLLVICLLFFYINPKVTFRSMCFAKKRNDYSKQCQLLHLFILFT